MSGRNTSDRLTYHIRKPRSGSIIRTFFFASMPSKLAGASEPGAEHFGINRDVKGKRIARLLEILDMLLKAHALLGLPRDQKLKDRGRVDRQLNMPRPFSGDDRFRHGPPRTRRAARRSLADDRDWFNSMELAACGLTSARRSG